MSEVFQFYLSSICNKINHDFKFTSKEQPMVWNFRFSIF